MFGPHDGKEQTFVLLDEWISGKKAELQGDFSIELATRYFASRGPPTGYDFVWWSGLGVTDAKHAIAGSSGLREIYVDGKIHYASGRGIGSNSDRRVHLLPAFDEFTIACRDGSAVISSKVVQKNI